MPHAYLLQRIASALLALALCLAGSLPAHAQDAASLRARHENLRGKLADNQFRHPLYLESSQSGGDLKGDVYATVELPFGVVAPALQGTDRWCDVLMLHLNVKNCITAGKPPGEVLSLFIGRKFDQPLNDAFRVDFRYTTPAATADYMQVQMAAAAGPMGTQNYRLMLEAVPLDAKTSFIHVAYAYSYGMAARVAMQGYLATLGRDKKGFSITSKDSDGKPVYLTGVRGVIERNTMRYHLAIDAYLGALAAPPAERLEKRLNDWFAATERYPVQLHEMERDAYLAMKRREVQRQQSRSAP